MSARDLESALREGGEKVGEGRIRIDSARALQRLRDFRFADPAHWVLEVLRAATLSHAKHVRVRTDADDVEISFDGKPFPADSMKNLLEQALNAANTPDEKRTRLLSLGVAGALGVNARFVKVTSGGVMLTLEGDRVEVEESKAKGTHLHLRKAFGWRVAAALFRGSPEARAITERARRYPATLELDGKELKFRAPSQVAQKSVEGKGFRLEARLPVGPPREVSRIEIDVGGVVVAERDKWLPGLQLEVWLRADDMRRNASGSDVVDDDPIFEAALVALRKVSRELLAAHGETLAADPDWRVAFKEKLKASSALEEQVKRELHKLPLFSGPSGEGLSLDQLAQGVRESSVVYTAKREFPKGSYPERTVLLEGELYTSLLPEAKRVDVAELVKSKQKVALARARHEQMEVEEALLPKRSWVARAKITATAVEGEVGFEAGGNGAFVRVLHKGRLMESGELTALAPLRLRAVVNWDRPLGDSYFVSDEGGSKLLGLVLKYVEQAATRAICDALPRPEVLPHALELLTRLVVHRNVPFSELPPELKAAPLIPCIGEEPVSLESIHASKSWPFADGRRPFGLLEGGRVLVLTPALKDLLRKLGPKKLEDVNARLRDEEEVRRRLAGPKVAAEVGPHVGAKVKIVEAGMHGEVGIPTLPGTRLMLTLLRSGFALETTELTARYNRASAVIDCAALKPNTSWNGAVRDDAFNRVTAVVHDAQRRLAAELVKEKRSHWRFGAEQFFIAFLKKELVPFDPGRLDEVTRAVANAPVFESMHGPRTLMQLHELVKRTGAFYVMSGRREVPEDFEVLVELPGVCEVLGEVLGVKPEDPSGALAALEAKKRLQAMPLAKLELTASLPLQVRHTEEHFTVLAALNEGVGDQASAQVHIDGRVYSTVRVPCALPLEVVIDAPRFEPNAFRELTGEQRSEVGRLVSSALQRVVQEALAAGERDGHARRAMLLAIAAGLERVLPPEDAERLLTRPLFPCTDGKLRSYRQVDEQSPQYVTTPMEGELPNRRSIIVASEAPVRLAVRRWPNADRVDEQLALQVAALRSRAAQAQVREIVSSVKSPWREKVKERDLTGELVVTTLHAGRLELYLDKKPLCVLEDALPAPLAGAIDSPRLTPKPGFKGVVDDGNLKEAIEALTGAAERFAAKLASADRVAELDPSLVQLAFWVGSTLAWQWKGKKKGKGKGKKKEQPATQHELMARQLLRASDTTTLSVQDLIEQQRAFGHVEVTLQGGRFLEPGRRAWWPRQDEQKWAEPLGFNYREVTAELQLADSIRQRPRYDSVDSPLPSQWRERIKAAGLEGEIAIGPLPDGKLVIEVLHERMLLETWSSDHPVGGVARVDSSALTPNETWTAVKRDASFKALVTATEAALERLLIRRLPASGSRPFAIAAVKWRSGQAGALAGVVPTLELFRDLKGGPITVGEVFELARKKGKVPVASSYFGNEAPGVVHDSAEARALLSSLGLEVEDVTGELRRAKDLQQALTARRLESLTWKGASLVKVNVSTKTLRGELALRTTLAAKDEASGVTLAKDGIAIGLHEDRWPGVVGVIDVKDLIVDERWTAAEPTRAQRQLIREQVDRLYAELAVKAPSYSHEQRELAAAWALRFLMDEGATNANDLPRLTGVSSELAGAPLFLTVEGEKVTLRAIAGEIGTREKIAVLERSWGRPDGVVSCVLATSSSDAPWLTALEELFGKTRVWRVSSLEEWENTTREADPPEGAPELHGLRFLRREVRLLRAGALGQLTPDDLEDVKLSRDGGGKAMRYDRKRKLALLDPEHPDVSRALKEAHARPERLWVLIASLFGLVNRELAHVTDVHEAQLLLALAGHLASNPKLLPTDQG